MRRTRRTNERHPRAAEHERKALLRREQLNFRALLCGGDKPVICRTLCLRILKNQILRRHKLDRQRQAADLRLLAAHRHGSIQVLHAGEQHLRTDTRAHAAAAAKEHCISIRAHQHSLSLARAQRLDRQAGRIHGICPAGQAHAPHKAAQTRQLYILHALGQRDLRQLNVFQALDAIQRKARSTRLGVILHKAQHARANKQHRA